MLGPAVMDAILSAVAALALIITITTITTTITNLQQNRSHPASFSDKIVGLHQNTYSLRDQSPRRFPFVPERAVRAVRAGVYSLASVLGGRKPLQRSKLGQFVVGNEKSIP